LNLKLYCIIIFADVWCTLPVWHRQPLEPPVKEPLRRSAHAGTTNDSTRTNIQSLISSAKKHTYRNPKAIKQDVNQDHGA